VIAFDRDIGSLPTIFCYLRRNLRLSRDFLLYGIDEQDLGRIFKAFYRTSAAKTAGITGTGLGLSIVRQVVERLGGTVSVASKPGRGTRFDVRLPLARA
jgi:signal transduction histidine kinase